MGFVETKKLLRCKAHNDSSYWKSSTDVLLRTTKKKQGGITTKWKMLEYEKYVYDT